MAAVTAEEIRAAIASGAKGPAAIARALGRPRTTVRDAIYRLGLENEMAGATPQSGPSYELPTFPDPDISVEEILDSMEKRFAKRQAHREARTWYPIKVNDRKPIGLSFFGDPHVDDNGCNIPLLRHHCRLHAETDGLYAVNVGDTENNWVGRLGSLYANQDTSRETAHRLAEWFLRDSGVTWLAWVLGNHDLWNDYGSLLRAMNVKSVPMDDWQARFKIVFPNGRECRIWTAHNFAGHSMWNSLHGPQRAAHMKSEADIYACGHLHTYAIHQEQSASRDFTYWLIRARGYKFIDDYAEKLGHFPQSEGASITCVIDPDAKSQAGFIQAFADMDAAVDYLKYLRAGRGKMSGTPRGNGAPPKHNDCRSSRHA